MLYVVLRGAAYGPRCSTNTPASSATSAVTPVSPGPAPTVPSVSSSLPSSAASARLSPSVSTARPRCRYPMVAGPIRGSPFAGRSPSGSSRHPRPKALRPRLGGRCRFRRRCHVSRRRSGRRRRPGAGFVGPGRVGTVPIDGRLDRDVSDGRVPFDGLPLGAVVKSEFDGVVVGLNAEFEVDWALHPGTMAANDITGSMSVVEWILDTRTAASIFVPIAYHIDKRSVKDVSGWEPSGLYYLLCVPLLDAILPSDTSTNDTLASLNGQSQDCSVPISLEVESETPVPPVSIA